MAEEVQQQQEEGMDEATAFLQQWAAQDATELAGLSLANAWMTSEYLQGMSKKIEAARLCVFASRALEAVQSS